MGSPTSTCGTTDSITPNLTIGCDPVIGSLVRLKNTCTDNNAESLAKATVLCQTYAGSEWTGYINTTNPCYYFNGGTGTVEAPNSTSSCGSSQAVGGYEIFCKRTLYNGDPTSCCFLDYDYTPNPNWLGESACFAGPTSLFGSILSPSINPKFTCNPNNRNVTSKSCKSNIESWCAGDDLVDPSDTQWISRWTEPVSYCRYSVNRLLNPTTPGLTYNDGIIANSGDILPAQNFINAKDIVSHAIKRYQSVGFTVGALPGTSQYSPFQDVMKDICMGNPGICQNSLEKICSAYNINQFLINPGLVQWCGCYLSNPEYANYTDVLQIPKECTPICNRPDTISLVQADGVTPKKCTSNICLIDNVNLTITNSIIGGNISFSQVCGGCSGSCQCFFDNIDVNISSSSIGGNINFAQNCGSNPTCYKNDPTTGEKVQVSCNSNLSYTEKVVAAQLVANNKAEKNKKWIVISMLLFLFAIFLVVYLFIFISTRKRNSIIYKKPVINSSKPLHDSFTSNDYESVYNKTLHRPQIVKK